MSGRRDSKAVAVILSALACPGAGQLYKRNYLRGGILVAASLVIVVVIVAKVAAATFQMTMGMPPDQVLLDVFGLAHRIMESQSGFLNPAGYLLLALWVYSIIDAAVAAPGPPRVHGR